MMIEFDEYKVKLNGLKPKLDELAASLGISAVRFAHAGEQAYGIFPADAV